MNGDTIRTHYGNGTAVPSEFMGGEVVEVEQEPEITQTSHTTQLPEPVPQPTPDVFIQPPAEPEMHPNNPDGLPARDLINERGFDSEIKEEKLADGTIKGTYTSGMTPMLLDYVDENEEEVWTFFKTAYSDGGLFGGETMTVSSPKTSYVYHYPTGSITLFTAGQVLGDSQPVAVESWTIHQALWGTDTWTQLELNNASVQTVIEEDADGITISAIRTTDDGVFTIDYVLNAGEELETFVSFTNNNPEWDGVPNMDAKSVLVTPAVPFIAAIPEVPAVESVSFANGTVTPFIPAIPAVPAQQAVPAVYSDPSWILSGTPYKFGFVQSIDSITLQTDEYVGYTEFKDVSNVLTFTDHLGIDIRYDFKDSKSELWSVNVDENGLISMDFRYAKGVVNFGETKGIDPSWEWQTSANSYYFDAQGHGLSTDGVTLAPTRCPDPSQELGGAFGSGDHTGQGRIATHPTTQTDPSCSFEAVEFDVSALPADAVITAKDLIFDVSMVNPPATNPDWTQSSATTSSSALNVATFDGSDYLKLLGYERGDAEQEIDADDNFLVMTWIKLDGSGTGNQWLHDTTNISGVYSVDKYGMKIREASSNRPVFMYDYNDYDV